jgi:hypothetical protein
MRWRLEKDLGYSKTRVFQVKNTSGSEIFDMIFATDHDVGAKIMDWMYRKASQQQAGLQQQAQARRRQTREEQKHGIFGLFDADDVVTVPLQAGYQIDHEDVPPHPYRLP